jgi:hypothetical protein
MVGVTRTVPASASEAAGVEDGIENWLAQPANAKPPAKSVQIQAVNLGGGRDQW